MTTARSTKKTEKETLFHLISKPLQQEINKNSEYQSTITQTLVFIPVVIIEIIVHYNNPLALLLLTVLKKQPTELKQCTFRTFN